MNTKFTPGPWRSEYPIVYAANGARLLTIDEYDCTTIHDAALIAAAPDLLAACEAVMRSFAYAPGHGPEYFEKARAAIARATGATA